MTARFSSEIQLQMPCRPMKSKSGRSARAQKSAKDSSKSSAPAPDAAASSLREAGLRRIEVGAEPPRRRTPRHGC